MFTSQFIDCFTKSQLSGKFRQSFQFENTQGSSVWPWSLYFNEIFKFIYSKLHISPDVILGEKGRAEHRLPASSWDFMAKLWKTIIHVSIVSSPQAVVRLGYLEMGISCEIRLSNYNNGYNGNVTAPHLPSLVITLYPLLLQNI